MTYDWEDTPDHLDPTENRTPKDTCDKCNHTYGQHSRQGCLYCHCDLRVKVEHNPFLCNQCITGYGPHELTDSVIK